MNLIKCFFRPRPVLTEIGVDLVDQELLKKYIGINVRLSCVFAKGESLMFYNGHIKEISNNTMIFVDKFNMEVIIDIATIREIRVFGGEVPDGS